MIYGGGRMIEYVTCPECRLKGKPQQEPNYYPNDSYVIAIQCPHCGSPLIHDDRTEEVKESLEKLIDS